MVCKLNKPKACFNCPYSDCLDTSYGTSKEETEYLNGLVARNKRKKYYADYFQNMSEEKKEIRRQRAKEYNRLHSEEINRRKREARKAVS